jgi:hypothetical protein
MPRQNLGDANNIIIGAAEVQINGTDVGYTKGGTTVRYEPEFIEVMADQAVGVVRKARSLERMFVTTSMLEVSLEQLRRAFMQPSVNLSGSTLTLGYNNACWVEELAIVLVGSAPGAAGVCGTRTFTFGRCVTFGTREYNMQREEETAFEVEFEILKDNLGHFGTIIDS